jgi:hypothetical protein
MYNAQSMSSSADSLSTRREAPVQTGEITA